MNISEARSRLLALPEEFARTGVRSVAVTRRGKRVLALVDWEFFESIEETLEILGDADLMAALHTSARQLREGKTVPWHKVKKELGL